MCPAGHEWWWCVHRRGAAVRHDGLHSRSGCDSHACTQIRAAGGANLLLAPVVFEAAPRCKELLAAVTAVPPCCGHRRCILPRHSASSPSVCAGHPADGCEREDGLPQSAQVGLGGLATCLCCCERSWSLETETTNNSAGSGVQLLRHAVLSQCVRLCTCKDVWTSPKLRALLYLVVGGWRPLRRCASSQQSWCWSPQSCGEACTAVARFTPQHHALANTAAAAAPSLRDVSFVNALCCTVLDHPSLWHQTVKP